MFFDSRLIRKKHIIMASLRRQSKRELCRPDNRRLKL